MVRQKNQNLQGFSEAGAPILQSLFPLTYPREFFFSTPTTHPDAPKPTDPTNSIYTTSCFRRSVSRYVYRMR